jgi:predicted transcriptional regulator
MESLKESAWPAAKKSEKSGKDRIIKFYVINQPT